MGATGKSYDSARSRAWLLCGAAVDPAVVVGLRRLHRGLQSLHGFRPHRNLLQGVSPQGEARAAGDGGEAEGGPGLQIPGRQRRAVSHERLLLAQPLQQPDQVILHLAFHLLQSMPAAARKLALLGGGGRCSLCRGAGG